MPGRGKCVSGTFKAIIYNVNAYFAQQARKSKGRDPPMLVSKMVEASGYCEQTVRNVISEKKGLEGAMFVSATKP